MSPNVLLKEATNDGTEQSIIMTFPHSPNVFDFFCRLNINMFLKGCKVFRIKSIKNYVDKEKNVC